MKKLFWKILYTYHHNRLLRAGWILAWQEGNATIEDLYNGDISENDPKTAAEETRDEWLLCC